MSKRAKTVRNRRSAAVAHTVAWLRQTAALLNERGTFYALTVDQRFQVHTEMAELEAQQRYGQRVGRHEPAWNDSSWKAVVA